MEHNEYVNHAESPPLPSPYPSHFLPSLNPIPIPIPSALRTKQIGKRVENENKCEYLSDLYAGTLQLQMWNMPKSGVCVCVCVCVQESVA